MTHQTTLFDGADLLATPEPQAQRLSRQCRAILERLRRGRAKNTELAAIALKYTGRISDLRKAGHDIVCVECDRTTGISVYELREPCK